MSTVLSTGLKRALQAAMQRALGLERYLFCFALYASVAWRRSEPGFFRFLRLIPNSGVILDVGANLGVTACYLARRKPDAQVFAFEPITWNVRTIHRMIAFSGVRNLSVEQCAIGNQNREVSIMVPIVNGARMHALGQVSAGDSSGEIFQAPCYRLDDLFPASSPHISALKVDVEGFEHEVFGGALELMRRDEPLIYCELWDNAHVRQTMELLAPLGYEISERFGTNYIFAVRRTISCPASLQETGGCKIAT